MWEGSGVTGGSLTRRARWVVAAPSLASFGKGSSGRAPHGRGHGAPHFEISCGHTVPRWALSHLGSDVPGGARVTRPRVVELYTH